MSTTKKINTAILDLLFYRPEECPLERSTLTHQLSLSVYPAPSEYEVSQELAKLKARGFVIEWADEFEDIFLKLSAAARATLAAKKRP